MKIHYFVEKWYCLIFLVKLFICTFFQWNFRKHFFYLGKKVLNWGGGDQEHTAPPPPPDIERTSFKYLFSLLKKKNVDFHKFLNWSLCLKISFSRDFSLAINFEIKNHQAYGADCKVISFPKKLKLKNKVKKL